MKKIITLFLCFVLIIAVGVVPAFSEGAGDDVTELVEPNNGQPGDPESPVVVEVNEETFPDPNFRFCLGLNLGDVLTEEDIKKRTSLDFDPESGPIVSMKGIEWFTELEHLSIGYIYTLKTLNISNNVKLRYLEINSTGLDILDISGCPVLCNLVKTESRQTNLACGVEFYYYGSGMTSGKFLYYDAQVVLITDTNATPVLGSGNCGDNLTWTLYESGIIRISGAGDMANGFFIPADLRNSIIRVEIGEGVTSIGNYAFADCDNLCTVSVAEGVRSIGYAAFRLCRSLVRVKIPSSLKSIGVFSFAFCSNLYDVWADGIAKTEHMRCYENTFLKISLPSTVDEIEYGAFISTSVGTKAPYSGTIVRIPEMTKSISTETFSGAGVRYIAMNPGYEQAISIGNQAFSNCAQLEYFEIEGDYLESLEIADNAFAGCNSTLTFISGFFDSEMDRYIEQYALNHGFRYMPNEKYPGDG